MVNTLLVEGTVFLNESKVVPSSRLPASICHYIWRTQDQPPFLTIYTGADNYKPTWFIVLTALCIRWHKQSFYNREHVCTVRLWHQSFCEMTWRVSHLASFCVATINMLVISWNNLIYKSGSLVQNYLLSPLWQRLLHFNLALKHLHLYFKHLLFPEQPHLTIPFPSHTDELNFMIRPKFFDCCYTK